MNTFSFLSILTILSSLLSIIGASGTDYNRLAELRNKLKDLQNVVENYNTAIQDSTQELGKDVRNVLLSKEIRNTFPLRDSDDEISFRDESLLEEVKEKLELLQTLLKDKSKGFTDSSDKDRFPPVPLQGAANDQRATVTRNENQRATVTRTGTDDQRATVTRNENQRATVTRTGTDDQRATVTRNENQRATVTRTGTDDQRATVTRNENQRATVTRTGTDHQRATVTKAKNSLSAEDAELVKKLESKFLHLKTFLQDSDEDTAKEKFKNHPEDPEHILITPSESLVRNLAPDDLELLKNIQEKIRQYQKTRSQGRGSEILGKSGDVEADVKDTNSEIWQDESLPDNQLGIEADVNPSGNVVEEVQRRFLSDIRYARENGVDIAQLLRTLPKKSARPVSNEELELKDLFREN